MSELNIPPQGLYQTPSISDFFKPPVVGMQPKAGDGRTFAEHLKEATIPEGVDVKFSAHAQRRMESRGIELDTDDWIQLDEAIDMAKMKGAHDSLVLMDGNAFVVNVDNRTVVTALSSGDTRGNVFTQIDSTIVMR